MLYSRTFAVIVCIWQNSFCLLLTSTCTILCPSLSLGNHKSILYVRESVSVQICSLNTRRYTKHSCYHILSLYTVFRLSRWSALLPMFELNMLSTSPHRLLSFTVSDYLILIFVFILATFQNFLPSKPGSIFVYILRFSSSITIQFRLSLLRVSIISTLPRNLSLLVKSPESWFLSLLFYLLKNRTCQKAI